MKDWSSLIALEIFKDVSPVRISWALFEWKEKVITSEIPLDTKVFLSFDIVLNFLLTNEFSILLISSLDEEGTLTLILSYP